MVFSLIEAAICGGTSCGRSSGGSLIIFFCASPPPPVSVEKIENSSVLKNFFSKFFFLNLIKSFFDESYPQKGMSADIFHRFRPSILSKVKGSTRIMVTLR